MEEAQARKSSYQRFGEKFGKYYTPAMFALAFVVATIPPLFWGGFSYWFYRGLVILVVSCSCGIALSVPVAVVAAIGNAARHGVLVKGGVYLEIAEKLKAIAFDKTGTITIGKPSVTDTIPVNNQTEETILQLAASIENYSEHPLGETIVNQAKERGLHLQKVDAFESLPGMGVKARIGAYEYFIGNKRLFLQLLTPGAASCNKTTTPISPPSQGGDKGEVKSKFFQYSSFARRGWRGGKKPAKNRQNPRSSF